MEHANPTENERIFYMALPKAKPEYEERYHTGPTFGHQQTVLSQPPSRTPAQKICTTLGVAFLVIGVAGMAFPGFLGAHLSGVHNLIHFVSGFLALGIGLKGTSRSAQTFSFVFGSVYGLLGVLGFMIGEPGISSTPHIEIDNNLWELIPGSLELGTNDHVIHLLIGSVFLIAAFMSQKKSEFNFRKKV